MAVHLVLSVRVKRHWPSFKENVDLLESEIQIPESFYQKLRRLAAVGVSYTVVQIGKLHNRIKVVVYHVSSNNTIARKIFDTSILTLRIYPTSALVLWFVSVFHLTWSLESVRCQVEEMATKRLMLSNREICTRVQIWFVRIHRWKRNHVTICRTVESLNCCFGFFTLIKIPYIFATFIAHSFGLLFVSIEGRSAVLHVSYSIILLQHFIHLIHRPRLWVHPRSTRYLMYIRALAMCWFNFAILRYLLDGQLDIQEISSGHLSRYSQSSSGYLSASWAIIGCKHRGKCR